MKKTELNELQRNNKTAMTAHITDSTVMVIFILLQATSNLVTPLYVLFAAILGFAPVAAELFFWRRNKETKAIKHLVAIGFAIFYTFCLFTSTNFMVFTFVIPMILVISIYNDVKYSLMINIGVLIESFILVYLGLSGEKYAYSNYDAAVIQIVFIILIGIYSYITSHTLSCNSKYKLAELSENQSKTEALLKEISDMSLEMKEGIEYIHGELELLDESSKSTSTAMQEVANGASDTADAVQQQLLQTEAIQRQVDTLDEISALINDSVRHTLSVIKDGQKSVDVLVKQVDESVKNGADVAQKLKELDIHIEEMNSIITLISDITSQTSLLSLNASIEAARAGDAGRGFAVVAGEISHMADQTSTATDNITNIIQSFASTIRDVVDVINHMIEGINEEKQSTANTESVFVSIDSNTVSVGEHVNTLTEDIVKLKEANQVITDSIQTISAVSEEVSAHSSETMNQEAENTAILQRIDAKMQLLMQLISKEDGSN